MRPVPAPRRVQPRLPGGSHTDRRRRPQGLPSLKAQLLSLDAASCLHCLLVLGGGRRCWGSPATPGCHPLSRSPQGAACPPGPSQSSPWSSAYHGRGRDGRCDPRFCAVTYLTLQWTQNGNSEHTEPMSPSLCPKDRSRGLLPSPRLLAEPWARGLCA